MENDGKGLGLIISQDLNLTQTVYATSDSILMASSKPDIVLFSRENRVAPTGQGTVLPAGHPIGVITNTDSAISDDT